MDLDKLRETMQVYELDGVEVMAVHDFAPIVKAVEEYKKEVLEMLPDEKEPQYGTWWRAYNACLQEIKDKLKD